jgi:hypothetical protein
MIVGDDPARRAVWLAELVKDEGWTETPRGLVCPECSSGPENAGKGKLYLRCRACGWVHFAVIKHGGDCCFRCRAAVDQLQPVENPALPVGVTVQGILWPPSEPSSALAAWRVGGKHVEA